MFKFSLFISILSLYFLAEAVSSYPAVNDNKSLNEPKSSRSPVASSQPDDNSHPTNNGNPFATIISRLNEKIKAANSGIYSLIIFNPTKTSQV